MTFPTDIMNCDEVNWNDVYDWMLKNDEYFQNICSGYNAYADIEIIHELIVTFKRVPISGKVFVILKNTEQFPNTFSPTTYTDWLFLCLEQAGFISRSVITLHQVKQKLSMRIRLFREKYMRNS